jgi:hypothetical protein
MRFAARFLVLVMTVGLVACSGGDATPPPLDDRFVTEADWPGSTIDPVETRETADDVEALVTTLGQHMVDAPPDEMTEVFQDAEFEQGGTEVRFFGEEHSRDAPHVFSSFYELGSEDGAASILDWLATDSKKPCPESCATVVSEFGVPGIPDASGVRRLTTAAAIDAAGTPNQFPHDSFWIAFTVGSSVYSMEYAGPPGTVTVGDAREVASAYYDRLTAE